MHILGEKMPMWPAISEN